MPIDPMEPDADFRMMTSPDEWPHWPLLPIIRRSDPARPVAVLFSPSLADDAAIYFLPERNLFDGKPFRAATDARVDTAAIRRLVDDGWTVD